MITMNPLDTINPDQHIEPTFEDVISKAHGNVPPADKPLANVYAPFGKLCIMHSLSPSKINPRFISNITIQPLSMH